MAAFAEAVSLMNTFNRLLHSCYISISPSSAQILTPFVGEIGKLGNVIRSLDTEFGDVIRCSETMNALDGQATQALRALQDSLDYFMYDRTSPEKHYVPEEGYPLIFDLEQVRPEVHVFAGLVKEMEEYFEELMSTPLSEVEEEDDDAAASSQIYHIDDGNRPKMVGFEDNFKIIQSVVSSYWEYPDFESGTRLVAALSGMAGVGKTTLAKEVYEHPDNLSQFDCRAWVTVG